MVHIVFNMNEANVTFAEETLLEEEASMRLNSQSSTIRNRVSRFSSTSREPTAAAFDRTLSYSKSKENKTKSIFEWNGGGRNVFIQGSWDNFNEKLPMESVRPGRYRIVLPIPSTERIEYKFVVDGEEKVAQDLPRIRNDRGMTVNVKHSDPTVSTQSGTGKIRKIMSKIRGLDLYSPLEGRSFASMYVFRVFYLLTIPSAGYYFYWLIFVGGNRNQPFTWIAYAIGETMSLFSAMIGLFSMWKPIRRKWRSLDALKPPLPEEAWPSVDIVIAHYKEDPDQMRESIQNALSLDYPAHLLHIIIADDGYFSSPKVVERSEIGVRMYQMLAQEAGYDPLMDEQLNEQGLVEHYKVQTMDEGLKRLDCALECHHFDFGPYAEERQSPGALPRLSLVARVKPDNHHNKAGNINNVMFNADTDGKIIVFLDSDMQVTSNFLLRTIPLMLEELADDSLEMMMPNDLLDPEIGIGSGNSSWRMNRDVAFVQAPQRFHNVDENDYMAHRNAVFYDGICNGRDGFGLTPFVGTNCVWRREVLEIIDGFVYGSVTEDTLTSNEVHARGFVSKYAAEDLAWGEAPVSVAAAMLQRQRWAKGAVMNGMKIITDLYNSKDNRNRLLRRGGEMDEYYEYRRTARRPNNWFVRAMFALDSTLYPFLGTSAYLYIITAVAYLATGEAPIAPESIANLAAAFITYYCIRYIAFYAAFAGVNMVDVLRSQQTWFSYNIAHVMGVFEALNTGKQLGWVANTGERNRRHWMEWVNIGLCVLMSAMICFRFIAFLAIDGGCAPWNSIGAIGFGFYILFNLWPMASISINERWSTADDEEKDHQTLSGPTALFVSIGTIVGVGFLASWARTPCGLLSQG